MYLNEIALYRISTWTGYYDMLVTPGVLWTPDCTILAIIYAPFLLGQLPPYSILWGLFLPMRPFAYKRSPKGRYFRELKVCLVTKGTNVQVSYLPSPLNILSHYIKAHALVIDRGKLYQTMAKLQTISECHFLCGVRFLR